MFAQDMQTDQPPHSHQANKDAILFTANRPDIVMERGEGMYIWDTAGNRYLDYLGGWAVNCLGHAPAVLRQALQEQAAKLVHASPAYYNKPMLEFAGRLTSLAGMDRAFFMSTGAEANEGAIKLARKHGARNLGGAYEVITAVNSFHGRTLGMMSATGKKQWESLFAPKVPGFRHVPLNDLEALTGAITPNTCAIMLELIQGEGGVHEAQPDYVKYLRRLCDEKGIMLIFDEVQTGLGRTGKLFAHEHYGVKPDIMTLGKGIGGGFPLSAMLVKEACNIFEPGDQGGTYTGQPLAMAVGLAVVNEIVRQDLAANSEVQGCYLLEQLHRIANRFGLANIRGKGLLIGFDLPTAAGSQVVAECLREGLLINSPGPSTIRLMPALIVTKADTDAMMRISERVLARVYEA